MGRVSRLKNDIQPQINADEKQEIRKQLHSPPMDADDDQKHKRTPLAADTRR